MTVSEEERLIWGDSEVPKVSRNYQREDFTELLSELHGDKEWKGTEGSRMSGVVRGQESEQERREGSCLRSVWIRSGMGNDKDGMEGYLRFFRKCRAEDADIHKLIVEHRALLQWQDSVTVALRVREDCWRIVFEQQGGRLYHNNYIRRKDGGRVFTGGYHEQKICGRRNFHNMVNVICGYSWEKHLEKMYVREDTLWYMYGSFWGADGRGCGEIRIS